MNQEFVGIIYVLELIAMWYLRLQPELPTLCHGPNATARAAQPYSLKGNQARTRADKSLAIVPYVQPAPPRTCGLGRQIGIWTCAGDLSHNISL